MIAMFDKCKVYNGFSFFKVAKQIQKHYLYCDCYQNKSSFS